MFCVFLLGNIRLIPTDQQNWSSTSNDVHSVLSDDLIINKPWPTFHVARHDPIQEDVSSSFSSRFVVLPADTLLLLLLLLWLLLLLLLFSSLELMRSDGNKHIILSADFSSYADDKSRKIDSPLIYSLIHLREFTVNACSSYSDLDIRSGDVSSDGSNKRGSSSKKKHFFFLPVEPDLISKWERPEVLRAQLSINFSLLSNICKVSHWVKKSAFGNKSLHGRRCFRQADDDD